MSPLTRQSISAPTRSIELASVSLETDTSEHSYTLQDIRVERSAPARPSLDEMAAVSPFAMAQLPPGPSTSPAFIAYRERMGMKPRSPMVTAETSPATSGMLPPPSVLSTASSLPPKGRRSLHVGRARSVPLRVSIDLPQQHTAEQTAINLADTELRGRLVRKRRRLPLKVVVLFGLISLVCLLVGLTTLSIGIYNFTKLKAGRAAKSINDLEAEIVPILNEILSRLGGKRR